MALQYGGGGGFSCRAGEAAGFAVQAAVGAFAEYTT